MAIRNTGSMLCQQLSWCRRIGRMECLCKVVLAQDQVKEAAWAGQALGGPVVQ